MTGTCAVGSLDRAYDLWPLSGRSRDSCRRFANHAAGGLAGRLPACIQGHEDESCDRLEA
jgi:hypothetical protein